MAHSIDDLRGKLTAIFKNSVFDVDQAIELVRNQMGEEFASDTAEKWDLITARMVEIYKAIPDDAVADKDRAFGVLEGLAANKAQGIAIGARQAIMTMNQQGDARSREKIGVMIQGGSRTPSMEREHVVARVLGLA